MKKIILLLVAALLLPLLSQAGEILPGSVPGTLNYQGRLERDNAPITGPVHLTFKIYNAASSGTLLWDSGEITSQATQGIFSADITPPVTVLAGGRQLYLEVTVESDTLSPREPLNSVAYAVVAKKLEDGSSVSVTTFTANYQVLLATSPDANVGIGTNTPDAKLTIDGDIKLTKSGSGITFFNGTFMTSAGVGSAAGLASDSNVTIRAANAGSGDIIFNTPLIEIARMTTTGKMGVGVVAPTGNLEVDGSFYVGNEGIYDRDDGEVNVKEDLVVEGGKVRGVGNNYLSLGETSNTLIAATNNVAHLWLDNAGNLGVGAAASSFEKVHSTGNIRSDTGLRGGNVSVGAYSNTWTALSNEVRAAAGSALLLQQTNSYNVGIGTDTPREKLHVRGSVRSDYGIIASTAAFSGDVRVNGTFTANSGQGNTVNLSSTVIYGTLQVTGGIGSQAGIPAYLASTQTLTGQNTFANQVVVSSDIITLNRIGAGVSDFDFPGTKYLQVGDNKPIFANDNALAYLVGGSNADAKLNFYRGASEAARLETQAGTNLALVVGGQTKTLTDATYHRIQNSAVWISTGYNTTPAIYVSSYMGNVGMGTTVMDPNWKLTIDGNMRFTGALSNGIIFADGTSIISAGSIGSATNISANGDAIVQSNADLSGGGDVVLRAGSLDGLVLNTSGNVGIGTLNPVSRLNVRGGDLVLGTPYNPYWADSVEDLVVGGNIAFDGELVQRSSLQVKLSSLLVANGVYLSTTTGTKTGVGTIAPYTTFDVNGSAQFGSGITKSTFTSVGVLQLASPLSLVYGGSGANLSGDAIGSIIYKSAGGTLGGSGQLTGMLKGSAGTGAPTGVTGTASYNTYWTDANTIAAEQFTSVTRGGTGAGTFTGVIKGNGTSAMSAMIGIANYNTYWSDANTIAAEQYAALSRGGSNADLSGAAQGGVIYKGASALGATGALTGVLRGNGTSAPSAMTGNANTIVMWGTGGDNISDSLITVESSTVNVNSHRIKNLVDPGSKQDAATKAYVDSATGSSGPAWSKYGNTVVSGNFLGSSNAEDLVIKTNNATQMTITSAGVIQFTQALTVPYGGTGGTTQATARTGLGLGSIATQSAGAVAITGGSISGITALAVADGGTGRSTLASGAVLLGNGTTGITSVAGQTVEFTVAKSTDTAQGCRKLTYSNGVLTAVVDANCNP